MDLTPGEKAVLGQIRVLYSASARRDQQIKALTMQWTPMHHESYKKAYASLLAKHLVHDDGGQVFTITDAGLKAIGVAVVRAQPARPLREERPVPKMPLAAARPSSGGSVFRRAIGLFRGRT